MKPAPSSCRTDAVSEPKPALCFSFYLGSPWHKSVPHPAPPRQSSASAIPNCSVLAERCFDLLLLAALIYPADWHLPTLTAHLSVPFASDIQQPNHGSAWINDKNHILPESPSFTGAVIRTIARGLVPQWWTECLHAEMPFCAQSIGFVWIHNKSSYPFFCLLLGEVFKYYYSILATLKFQKAFLIR